MRIYAKYIDYIMARNHKLSPQILHLRFESNVIYIGTKTNRSMYVIYDGLRVM